MPTHKVLKSIAHNFSHSFISLMNYVDDDYFLGHLLIQMHKTKLNRLTIDILNKSAFPEPLLSKKIKTSIQGWCEWFPGLVKNSQSTMDHIKSAIIVIEFDLERNRPNPVRILEKPFFCEMEIIDDRGKAYKCRHEDWWYPESNGL